MQRVGARELKQHTGAVLARVQEGERIVLTMHGTPIAVISPINPLAIKEAVAAQAAATEQLGWLKISEASFRFWDNEEDDVWDQIAVP